MNARIYEVAFSDPDRFSGYTVAYFDSLPAARACRDDHRAHGRHAILGIASAALIPDVLINKAKAGGS